MSLVVLAVVGASVGASAVVARLWYGLRRRQHTAERAPSPERDPGVDGDLDPRLFATLPLRTGDVIDVDGESRWLGAAVLLVDTTGVRSALCMAPEEGPGTLVAAFPPPSHHIYWLEAADLELPPGTPTTLDAGGALLELRASYPVELASSAKAPALGARGKVALYEGPGARAALLLRTEKGTHLWCGRRVAAGDYEKVGHVARQPDDA
ncbi:MAG: hypothetical protein IT373_18275 [Polyangiaceae bacterium]|nr:hypothetical protein [Polyangiaceae bacterium]